MVIVMWAGSSGEGGPPGRRLGHDVPKSGEHAGLRVLIVDDDPSILGMVEDILRAEGYEVATAAGGRQAIELAKTWRPTLLLLDMRMPVVDGWAVARAVRESGIRVPIVVMTAAENAARWADEIGADAYIAKPFHLDDLLRVVEGFRSGGGRPN